MNHKSIKFMAAITAAMLVSPAFSQESNFQGWSTALGASVVDGNLEASGANQSQSLNLGRTRVIGTLDVGYSFPLDAKWSLGVGGSFDLNNSRILDVVLLNGKLKNHTSVYLQPTYSLTSSTAVFAKIGYHSAKLVGNGGLFSQSNEFSESVNGTGLGFGIKSFVDKNVFTQFEFMNTNYKNKAVSFFGDSSSIKPTTTSINLSVGYQF